MAERALPPLDLSGSSSILKWRKNGKSGNERLSTTPMGKVWRTRGGKLRSFYTIREWTYRIFLKTSSTLIQRAIKTPICGLYSKA